MSERREAIGWKWLLKRLGRDIIELIAFAICEVIVFFMVAGFNVTAWVEGHPWWLKATCFAGLIGYAWIAWKADRYDESISRARFRKTLIEIERSNKEPTGAAP